MCVCVVFVCLCVCVCYQHNIPRHTLPYYPNTHTHTHTKHTQNSHQLTRQPSTLRDYLLTGELEPPTLPPPTTDPPTSHFLTARPVPTTTTTTHVTSVHPPYVRLLTRCIPLGVPGVRVGRQVLGGAAVLEMVVHRVHVDYTYDDSVPKLIVRCGIVVNVMGCVCVFVLCVFWGLWGQF